MRSVELVVVMDIQDRLAPLTVDEMLSAIAATTTTDRKTVLVDRSRSRVCQSLVDRGVDIERFEPPDEYKATPYLSLASAFSSQLRDTLFDALLCVTGDGLLRASLRAEEVRSHFDVDPNLGLLCVNGEPPASVRRMLSRALLDPRTAIADPRSRLRLLSSVFRA